MKTVDTLLAKRLLLALCLIVAVAGAWLAPLEASAKRTVDSGLKRALISYASARALDAVISVAQGTEIAVQPAGVGVVLAPGQALDPVNDLVEQFADLMLTASVAFGVQKVLLVIGAHWTVSSALTLVALAWLTLYLRRAAAPASLSRLLAVLLMIRFALPLVVIGSNTLFEHFMAADYHANQQAIDSVSGQLATLAPAGAATAGDASLLDKLKAWAAQQSDVKGRYEQIKQAAEQATERMVKLMVIFLLQTQAFPIVLLAILWGLTRRLFEPLPPRDRLLPTPPRAAR